MTPFKTILITAAFAIAGLSGTAQAASISDRETVTVRVAYADLNLNSDEGVTTFMKRVDRAATRACGGKPGRNPIELQQRAAFRACKADAMGDAVAQANNTLVSVRFAEKQGRVYAMASR